MKIEFSATARRDLTLIRGYIAQDLHRQDNEAAAERVILRILQSIRHLGVFPELGPPWQDTTTRALSVPGLPYRVHYQIGEAAIEVLTVVHTRRQEPPLA